MFPSSSTTSFSDFRDWSPFAIVCMVTIDNAFSQVTQSTMTGHVYLGKLTIEKSDPEIDGDDFENKTVGVDAQLPMSEGIFEYGIEAGALFGWDTDSRHFSASSGSGGGSVSISVDVNFFPGRFFLWEAMSMSKDVILARIASIDLAKRIHPVETP